MRLILEVWRYIYIYVYIWIYCDSGKTFRWLNLQNTPCYTYSKHYFSTLTGYLRHNIEDSHIDGLVLDCSNSSALAMALLQPRTKPSLCSSEWVNISANYSGLNRYNRHAWPNDRYIFHQLGSGDVSACLIAMWRVCCVCVRACMWDPDLFYATTVMLHKRHGVPNNRVRFRCTTRWDVSPKYSRKTTKNSPLRYGV